MSYRADPITQRDGSPLASSNCRMAAGATGIDYHTLGETTSSGEAMRERQGDQSGGTDAGDLADAWRSYGQSLSIVTTGTWSTAESDLRAGRLVMLDVWHATAGGPCLSGSGAYGHTMAVAPEASGSRWLTADPWCSPANWQWWEGSRLGAGAEEWGRRVSKSATGGRGWHHLPPAILAAIVRELMTRWTPERPATGPDAETAGAPGGPILYTRTAAHGESEGAMSRFVNAAGYEVESGWRVRPPAGTKWLYLDGSPGGTFGDGNELVVLGRIDASGSQLAAIVGTGAPYTDKETRPTIVRFDSSAAFPVDDTDGAGGEPGPDADAVRAERDAEWRDWLLAGSPGEPPD